MPSMFDDEGRGSLRDGANFRQGRVADGLWGALPHGAARS